MARSKEQVTLNQRVPGSSPGAPTNKINHLTENMERRAIELGSRGNQWGNSSRGRARGLLSALFVRKPHPAMISFLLIEIPSSCASIPGFAHLKGAR
jgi:hypothetical protein